ncbi:MAG TPA: ribonuclease P [Thermofilum sp.]|nr:ribonuclease P [Thermofilum sp.]
MLPLPFSLGGLESSRLPLVLKPLECFIPLTHLEKKQDLLKCYFLGETLRGRFSRKRYLRDLAVQRARRLVELSWKMHSEDEELARRYNLLAMALLKRVRAKVPRDLKRKFCRKCGTPLIPGRTARVRLVQRRFPHVVITCLYCGKVYRIPYLREKKARKSA